jgi:DNA-binding transcriptional LysR family regulator
VAGPVGSAARAALDGVAGRGRWQPRVTHEALEFPAVLALVAAGLGCALVPRLALATAPAAVRVVELHGLGARRLLARHRSSRSEPAPAVRAVVDALVVAAAGPV